jgi:hypothetical protein
VTSFGPGDQDLHDAKGRHRGAPAGDRAEWNRRMEAHVQLHVRAAVPRDPVGSPWGQGAHIPRQLRTSMAES